MVTREPLDTNLIYTICDSHPPVSLYNVSKLYIHFKSLTYPGTGFRLSFSFHALSALPQQLRDGRWNCSVPHWPDFRLHFPCNLVSDCVGGEDEVDCPYTSHCIPDQFRCDGFWNCRDGSDEMKCPCHRVYRVKCLPPPAVIDIDSDGVLTAVKPLITTNEPLCPETHFQCPGLDIYCLPVYVRCNGVFDCPGKQDETTCDTYTCPGYYRCRSSHVCLHPDHVCDGWSQCPEGDDELLCDLSCPDTCVCHGLAFTCTARFAASSYLELRFLDAKAGCSRPMRGQRKGENRDTLPKRKVHAADDRTKQRRGWGAFPRERRDV
ncbi:hypothetical protein C0Q70_02435 [Pomacea canaliculata]|uniref:CUB domain-containing protein n=1 Tax=Pomacea canaliculata TaxID=400727 RepID=A0A2T7PPX4_POMCA|nr:hypothetical protein C0Q70_02435 [Pomacea canaliculata]